MDVTDESDDGSERSMWNSPERNEENDLSGDDAASELSDELSADTEQEEAVRGRASQPRRADCRRKSKARAAVNQNKIKGREHLSDAETEALHSLRASDKRQRRAADEMYKLGSLRPDILAEIINRLIHKLNPGDRARLRKMTSMQQEQYLAVREAVDTMERECFNARNSVDLRTNEAMPISTTNKIRDVFCKDKDGKRVVLASAPDFRGDCNPLTRENNIQQGIKWAKGQVRVPFPFKNSAQIRAAGKDVIAGRTLHLADDIDGAAWDALDMGADVLHQAAKDNNLLELPKGEMRELQVIFDGHGWTSRSGATRFLVRTPHTKFDHNSGRYGRDVIFYMGHDKHAFLEKAIRIGGEDSLHSRMYDGLKVDTIKEEEMPECEREHAAADLFSLRYART